MEPLYQTAVYHSPGQNPWCSCYYDCEMQESIEIRFHS